MLKNFDGDVTMLATAEKFLLDLISLPLYWQRLEGLLLKAKFQTSSEELIPNLRAFVNAGEGLIGSHSLIEFFRYALHAGNFVNAVSLTMMSDYVIILE
jgi:hypothetical protein